MKRQILTYLAVWVANVALSMNPLQADEFSDQRAFHWHQWRGPQATGVAPQGDPPTHWSDKTNVKWKVAIPGRGTSTPVIWGDRVFLMTAINTGRQDEQLASESAAGSKVRSRDNRVPSEYHQFVVLCLDRNTGNTLWRRVACEVVPHERHHPTNSFVAASPITNGKFVYCSFGSRGVYCYDMDGNPQWTADLGQFEIKFSFGEGASPALYRDSLIVNCDHEGESFITALDASTGKPKWKVARDEKSTWNTPLVAEYKGRAQVLVNGAVKARSYDLATGDLLWEYGGRPGVDAIPSPLHFGEVAIFVSGLKDDPAYAIPLSSSGDLREFNGIAWSHTEGTPQIATPVLVGDRLFFTKDRAGIMTCLNAHTGEVIMARQRLPGLDDVYPSPVAAAGRVYFSDRKGATVVVDATADDLVILAENKLDDTIVGSPAIVGRQMFVRGEQGLYCILEDAE
jgi:outer membrane protein assembly factor BamB